MTGALLLLAAGLLVWPDPVAGRRARLTVPAVRPAEAWRRWPEQRWAPPIGATLAGAVGALAGGGVVAGLAAAGAAVAVRAWAAHVRDGRTRARLGALVEALGGLSAELRSGRPPEVALAAAARAVGGELGADLLRSARAGPAPGAPGPRAGPLASALGRLSAGIRLSARTGASLAEVVAAVEDDLRARERHRLELRAAVAGPRASATVLAGLPVLGLAMGSGVGADPWHVLTATGPGNVLLVVGVGLEAAGIAWSRRLVDRAVRSSSATAP